MHIQSSSSMSSWQHTPPTQQQLKTQASELFSTLDSSAKGYLDATDFSQALQSVQQDTPDSQASEWFSQLDADADGKLTSDEFSTAVSEQLYNARGMMGAGGPPAGPAPSEMRGMPPPEEDSGKTVDELTAMLQQATDTDSRMASDLQSLIEQFDSADSDRDGKVTRDEAMAFKDSQQTKAGADASNSTTTSASQQQLQHTLMQLMKSYGATAAMTVSSANSLTLTA